MDVCYESSSFVGILVSMSMIIGNVIIIRIGFQYSLCGKYKFAVKSLEYPIRTCSLHSQHTMIRIIHSLFAGIDKRIAYSESKQFMKMNSYFS